MAKRPPSTALLNCSILDGWWDEMFDGSNGWAITSAEAIPDVAHRDEVEANSLFELLERQIIPLYYDRRGGRFPREWVTRVKASLRSLGPKVMATRMVRDYLDEMYEPIAAASDALAARRLPRPGQELTAWKQRVTAAWAGVKVEVDPDPDVGLVALGDEREVTAEVHLGSLTPDDVAVELLHGPVAASDELAETRVVRLERAVASGGGGPGADGVVRYEGRFSCGQAGRHGYAVRVRGCRPTEIWRSPSRWAASPLGVASGGVAWA